MHSKKIGGKEIKAHVEIMTGDKTPTNMTLWLTHRQIEEEVDRLRERD